MIVEVSENSSDNNSSSSSLTLKDLSLNDSQGEISINLSSDYAATAHRLSHKALYFDKTLLNPSKRQNL